MKTAKKQRHKRTVTVLDVILEGDTQFSITDLKNLNGGAFYLDFKNEFPKKELSTKRVLFGNTPLDLFEFPISFEEKLKSKIFYHFTRKAKNLRLYPLKKPPGEDGEKGGP